MSGIPPFDPDAGEPGYLWEAVAAHLTARIEANDLPPGARLPTNVT
jgi:DNA-binding FadR family transcriptional regulator